MTDKITRKKHNFTQISHKILYDERLSYKARGIFAYLWGKPEDWKVLVKYDLVKNGKETEYSVRRALHELREFGYMKWERLYTLNQEGKSIISGIHYSLDDEGKISLRCDSQNEDLLNEDPRNVYNNKEKTNKDLNNKECNAMHEHFSQNEILEETKPSTTLFEQEWWRCSQMPPNRGFTQEYINLFWERYKSLGVPKKALHPNWESYLKEWTKGEKKSNLIIPNANILQIENNTPCVVKSKRIKEIHLTPMQRKFLNALVSTVNKGLGNMASFNWLKSNVELSESTLPNIMKFTVPDKYAKLRFTNDYITDIGTLKRGTGALLYEAMQIIYPTCKKFEVEKSEESCNEFKFV